MKWIGMLLAASLVANAALVGLLLTRPALAPASLRDLLVSDADRAAVSAAALRAERARAATAARIEAERAAAARARLWSRLDSDDLPTLASRLRAAGFPARTVRSILTARLEAIFRPRIAELTRDTLAVPFWKPDPMGFGHLTRLLESLNQISRERSQMARQLFSDPFFTQDPAPASDVQRARYGDLPRAKVDIVERINHDYAEMEQQIRTATQGILLPEDRAKLALLQQERRKDLATVLNPAELEDYLMRSSPITTKLRAALTVMDATEAEFHALYQIHLPHADVLFPGLGSSGLQTMEMLLKRRELQETLGTQIRSALGETRTQDFDRASNSEYQQLARLAQRENLPPAAAVRAFDLRNQAARESVRVYEDRTLTAEQKRASLQALAQATTNQLLATLGSNAGPLYLKSASWLPMIASGSAVTFSPEGGWGSRSVSPAPAAGAPGRP